MSLLWKSTNYLLLIHSLYEVTVGVWLIYFSVRTTCKFSTLVSLQPDPQIRYLFIYNTFIKILYIFRAVRCSSSGGLIVSMQHLISSLSVWVTVLCTG